MKYYPQYTNNQLTSVRIQMSDNFVRNLRRYLHLSDDAPLNIHGEIRAVASGFGWYTMYAYNSAAKGAELRFALKILKLCEDWIHKNVVSEIRLLIASPAAKHMTRQEEHDLTEQFRKELGLPEPEVKKIIKHSNAVRAAIEKPAKVITQKRADQKAAIEANKVQALKDKSDKKIASANALAALQRKINGKYHQSSTVH